MTITPLHRVVQYKDKHSVVKGLIYLRLLEKGLYLPDNELNILALFGVFSDKEKVIQEALSQDFYKSYQTVDNTISRLVRQYKFLEKGNPKSTRKISADLFPEGVETEFIAATLKVHNIQVN
jgi:hypothetical protein